MALFKYTQWRYVKLDLLLDSGNCEREPSDPREYINYLLETLPSAKTSDLENLLPWSESIPDHCRVPVKASNKKPDKPKYSSKNGPLHLALLKLRARYRDKEESK